MHLGGVEQRTLMLATGLDPKRFEQIVICTKALGALPARFAAANCPVHTIGSFKKRIDWMALGKAQRILETFRPDIVHGAVYEGVVTAVIAGRRAGVPIIIGEETADPLGRRWTGHAFMRLLTMFCDRVVGVSPFVARYLRRTLRIPRRKVVMINNGLAPGSPTDPQRVAQIRRELGLMPADLVIGTVSRLSEWHKRVSDAVRATALLAEAHPNLKLIVVGEGPDEQALRTLAAELGIADRVKFAGYQPDTRPFYDCMDVFVHVPSSEAFGLVLVEAMFAGLPVVASRVGGIPDIVVDGATGFLVDRYDPVQTAEAVGKLLDQPDLRARFGRAACARAEENYSQERYAAEITAMYDSLLAEKRLSSD
jgi:glycosyltransferase involved in cell wall biosynthesis